MSILPLFIIVKVEIYTGCVGDVAVRPEYEVVKHNRSDKMDMCISIERKELKGSMQSTEHHCHGIVTSYYVVLLMMIKKAGLRHVLCKVGAHCVLMVDVVVNRRMRCLE